MRSGGAGLGLSGKTALVTGGTDGIGLEIARQLKDAGATVVVAGRDPARLDAARAQGLESIAADLSSATGCDALVEAVHGRLLDILVNNAGAGAPYLVDEPIDPDAVDRAIYTNLHAPIRLATRLLEGLRGRPAATIVNVTSGLAIAPRAGAPVYCATKAGLRSFTQALRAQLAGTTVRVVEALPPLVATRMTEGRHKGAISAAECARQIVAGMAAGKPQINVGQTKLLDAIHNVAAPVARRIMLRF
ncbi:SDR family oxidoreductase [Sphingomonas sp.]|jgi:uncharacterized oxidoreductase|uniref:SDR family oxidoreductase n=1 Tax=Sphingomonas sp. TaxID=28214 RepID=UPI002D7FB956|nr:SDR family NAD(P)-dependent oxidoreductase [Sphingomonas sp.]HEU0044096.1 SDR family NAD(P)-dependent oxidoreductase [Sphingomonas sp.]